MNEEETNEKYYNIKLLNYGQYGKAYLVGSPSDKSLYVIKQIDIRFMSYEERISTMKEAEILERCNHPNITQFKEVYFTSDETLEIVMEYADGGDLEEKIRRQNGNFFEENQILEWFTQICLGLKHLHDQKIIHRDLKSQNIFLTKEGVIKLGDFGISKILEYSKEYDNKCIGTPYYLAPEIFDQCLYSPKGDIWALGVVLYEMCALTHPFKGQSFQGLSLAVQKGFYEPLPTHFSLELKMLVNKLLQVDRDQRLTIDEVLQQPIITRITSLWQQQCIMTFQGEDTFIRDSSNTPRNVQNYENNLPNNNFEFLTNQKTQRETSLQRYETNANVKPPKFPSRRYQNRPEVMVGQKQTSKKPTTVRQKQRKEHSNERRNLVPLKNIYHSRQRADKQSKASVERSQEVVNKVNNFHSRERTVAIKSQTRQASEENHSSVRKKQPKNQNCIQDLLPQISCKKLQQQQREESIQEVDAFENLVNIKSVFTTKAKQNASKIEEIHESQFISVTPFHIKQLSKVPSAQILQYKALIQGRQHTPYEKKLIKQAERDSSLTVATYQDKENINSNRQPSRFNKDIFQFNLQEEVRENLFPPVQQTSIQLQNLSNQNIEFSKLENELQNQFGNKKYKKATKIITKTMKQNERISVKKLTNQVFKNNNQAKEFYDKSAPYIFAKQLNNVKLNIQEVKESN